MIEAADTAWVLISSALVLLMIPGLAFFYGGLVRKKNIAGTLMQVIVTMGVVGVVWVLWATASRLARRSAAWLETSNGSRYLGLAQLRQGRTPIRSRIRRS